jgi:hypothetical protein
LVVERKKKENQRGKGGHSFYLSLSICLKRQDGNSIFDDVLSLPHSPSLSLSPPPPFSFSFSLSLSLSLSLYFSLSLSLFLTLSFSLSLFLSLSLSLSTPPAIVSTFDALVCFVERLEHFWQNSLHTGRGSTAIKKKQKEKRFRDGLRRGEFWQEDLKTRLRRLISERAWRGRERRWEEEEGGGGGAGRKEKGFGRGRGRGRGATATGI